MIRLLHVTTVSGTLEAFLLPFARHFREKGWRVDAMANGTEGSAQVRDAFNDVFEAPWGRSPARPANFLRAPRALRRVIEDGDYDIVHVHTPVASFITRFALRRTDKPQVVYTAHGLHFHPEGSRWRNAAFRFLERRAISWTDRIVVINRTDRVAAVDLGYPTTRVHHIPGIGVDANYYTPNGPGQNSVQLRTQLGLPPQARVVLMIGEFTQRKRHEDAIRTVPLLSGDVHLLLAGSGPREEEMRQLAESLGCGDRVQFLGHRRDIPELIRSADITLLTSTQEGLPRCILESMSMGIPVVASDVRGNRDLLEDGAGFLVPLGDTEQYARTLQKVLDDPTKASQMGRLGRQQVQAQYDITRILEAHEELYGSLRAAVHHAD